MSHTTSAEFRALDGFDAHLPSRAAMARDLVARARALGFGAPSRRRRTHAADTVVYTAITGRYDRLHAQTAAARLSAAQR
jgi:hypothetical protein